MVVEVEVQAGTMAVEAPEVGAAGTMAVEAPAAGAAAIAEADRAAEAAAIAVVAEAAREAVAVGMAVEAAAIAVGVDPGPTHRNLSSNPVLMVLCVECGIVIGGRDAARCWREEWREAAMEGEAAGFVAGVRKCFEGLRDPRVQASCDHLLFDIVSIAVLAVACGADAWTDREVFGKKRREWLATFLELPHGIPSHDTFRRVFGVLNRKEFSACLLQWTQALHEASGGKLIAIDGKSLRRSGRQKSGLRMLHLVTAWSSENGLTLAQVACDEKSNEITAIPEVLKLLSLKGCTVTIDAMGCQTEIVQQIRTQ